MMGDPAPEALFANVPLLNVINPVVAPTLLEPLFAEVIVKMEFRFRKSPPENVLFPESVEFALMTTEPMPPLLPVAVLLEIIPAKLLPSPASVNLSVPPFPPSISPPLPVMGPFTVMLLPLVCREVPVIIERAEGANVTVPSFPAVEMPAVPAPVVDMGPENFRVRPVEFTPNVVVVPPINCKAFVAVKDPLLKRAPPLPVMVPVPKLLDEELAGVIVKEDVMPEPPAREGDRVSPPENVLPFPVKATMASINTAPVPPLPSSTIDPPKVIRVDLEEAIVKVSTPVPLIGPREIVPLPVPKLP